jgi:hypothetical protein
MNYLSEPCQCKSPLRTLGTALLCLTLIILISGSDTTGADQSVSNRYMAQALQGNLSQTMKLFEVIPSPAVTGADQELAKQFRSRFLAHDEGHPQSSGDEFIDDVVSIYRRYWLQSLMGELSSAEAEIILNDSLGSLLSRYNLVDESAKNTDLFNLVGKAIEKRGFHYVNDYSPPLQDLMIWREQSVESYEVELTDGILSVPVIFMDDFYSLGWSYFATLGLAPTGGWASADALYCVGWVYDRESENFKVSYLKHEGRHFADYARYPELQEIDLEYRAKLTELAFASSSLSRLLREFSNNAAPNPDSPHAYANYQVSHDLYQAIFHSPLPDTGEPWELISAGRVNPAARALLAEHTRKLESADAAETRGVVY